MPAETVRAIILAAGKGVRMDSDRAKVLHEILGAPMIRYAIENVEEAGLRPILVVVGYQAEAVKKAVADLGVACVIQKDQKGTADAVLSCASELRGFQGQVLVMSGDTPLITSKTIQAMIETNSRSRAACTILTACIDDPTGYGRIVRDPKSGHVLKIVEESDAAGKEREIREINTACYIFDAPSLFQALQDVRSDNKKNEYYLTDVIQILSARGRTVEAYRSATPTEAFGINTRRDLVAATNYIRWKILDHLMNHGVCIVDPSTTFVEPGVTVGRDTVIHPFTVIRRGVTIGSHCEVGPYSHLRAGTVLEDHAEIGNFVEVKKSRVGSRTKAKHLTYLGDATIGRDVNIGAGTITANFDGRAKHETFIGDEASTGSGTVLVAPVRMGKRSRTGAGAIVTKGHDVQDNDTVVGVPARPVRKRPDGE